MKPMIDPKRDLKGATPETLARALFRRVTPLERNSRRTCDSQISTAESATPSCCCWEVL